MGEWQRGGGFSGWSIGLIQVAGGGKSDGGVLAGFIKLCFPFYFSLLMTDAQTRFVLALLFFLFLSSFLVDWAGFGDVRGGVLVWMAVGLGFYYFSLIAGQFPFVWRGGWWWVQSFFYFYSTDIHVLNYVTFFLFFSACCGWSKSVE